MLLRTVSSQALALAVLLGGAAGCSFKEVAADTGQADEAPVVELVLPPAAARPAELAGTWKSPTATMTLRPDGTYATRAQVRFSSGPPGQSKGQVQTMESTGRWGAHDGALYFESSQSVRKSPFRIEGGKLRLSVSRRVETVYERQKD